MMEDAEDEENAVSGRPLQEEENEGVKKISAERSAETEVVELASDKKSEKIFENSPGNISTDDSDDEVVVVAKTPSFGDTGNQGEDDERARGRFPPRSSSSVTRADVISSRKLLVEADDSAKRQGAVTPTTLASMPVSAATSNQNSYNDKVSLSPVPRRRRRRNRSKSPLREQQGMTASKLPASPLARSPRRGTSPMPMRGSSPLRNQAKTPARSKSYDHDVLPGAVRVQNDGSAARSASPVMAKGLRRKTKTGMDGSDTSDASSCTSRGLRRKLKNDHTTTTAATLDSSDSSSVASSLSSRNSMASRGLRRKLKNDQNYSRTSLSPIRSRSPIRQKRSKSPVSRRSQSPPSSNTLISTERSSSRHSASGLMEPGAADNEEKQSAYHGKTTNIATSGDNNNNKQLSSLEEAIQAKEIALMGDLAADTTRGTAATTAAASVRSSAGSSNTAATVRDSNTTSSTTSRGLRRSVEERQELEAKRAIGHTPGTATEVGAVQHQQHQKDNKDFLGVSSELSMSTMEFDTAEKAPSPPALPPLLQGNNPLPMEQNTLGLVEARAVESVAFDVDDVEYADEYVPPTENDIRDKERRRLWYLGNTLGCFCCAIVGIVILILYFGTDVFEESEKVEIMVTKAPTVAPSTTPTLAPTPYLLPLPEFTIQAIENDPQSPQSLAYQWLKDDDMTLDSASTEARLLQRYALATFYYATGGNDTWTLQENWLSHEHHECSWYSQWTPLNGTSSLGVCDDRGMYMRLMLTKNGLSGTLPPEITLMSELQEFDVADNEFISGTIPSQIGLMTSLSQLILDGNQLTGSVPTQLGQLTELEMLFLHVNPLEGTMPTELGLMSSLEELQWWSTRTVGTIPSELGVLTSMTSLYLANNFLEGSIPTQLFRLTTLEKFFGIDLNLLTGTVPTEVGLLSKVGQFYGDYNYLTGSIPTEIGGLTDVMTFLLHGNLLTGNIPTEVGRLSDILVISMYGMGLTGALPSQLGLLTSAYKMDFEINELSSSVPQELYENLVNLELLYLSDNFLTGTIPPSVGNMTSLVDLYLDGNDMSGTLPTEFGLLKSLGWLGLYYNNLSGAIPSQFGNMTSLVELEVHDTLISGQVPTDLGNLGNYQLETLELHNTLLSGILPEDICAVPWLEFNCTSNLCGCSCVCINFSGGST